MQYFLSSKSYMIALYKSTICIYRINYDGTFTINKSMKNPFQEGEIRYFNYFQDKYFIFVVDSKMQQELIVFDENFYKIHYQEIPYSMNILDVNLESGNNFTFLVAIKIKGAIRFALYNFAQKSIKFISPNFNNPELGFWDNNRLLAVNQGGEGYLYEYQENSYREIETFPQSRLLSTKESNILLAKTNRDTDIVYNYNLLTDELIELDIETTEVIRANFTFVNNDIIVEYINKGKWQYAFYDSRKKEYIFIDNLPGVFTGGVYYNDSNTIVGRFETISLSPSVASFNISSDKLEVFKEDKKVSGVNYIKGNYKYLKSSDIEIPYVSFNDHEKEKAIIYLHGGPHSITTETYSPFLYKAVQSGFRVICVNYPGSIGYGKSYKNIIKNDWGGSDLESILGIRIEVLKDYNSVSIYGISYGGYLSLLAAGKRPEYWNKVVACAPFTDLKKLYEDGNAKIKDFLTSNIYSILENDLEIKKRSPVNYINNLAQSNILLIHGAKDKVCPVTQSELLYEKIRKHKGENKIRFVKLEELAHENYSEEFWFNEAIEFISKQ